MEKLKIKTVGLRITANTIMESLVLSHKKIVNALVYAFTFGLNLPIKGSGYFFRHESEDDFYQIQLWRSATKPENGDAKLLMDHSISKHKAEMNDYRIHNISKYLEDECRGFVSTCMGRIVETPIGEVAKQTIPESDLVRSFSPDEFPHFEEEDGAASVDVLVDKDGNRTDFAIGYYSFVDQVWKYSDGFTHIDTSSMRWYYPPYAKYDKHKVKDRNLVPDGSQWGVTLE